MEFSWRPAALLPAEASGPEIADGCELECFPDEFAAVEVEFCFLFRTLIVMFSTFPLLNSQLSTDAVFFRNSCDWHTMSLPLKPTIEFRANTEKSFPVFCAISGSYGRCSSTFLSLKKTSLLRSAPPSPAASLGLGSSLL